MIDRSCWIVVASFTLLGVLATGASVAGSKQPWVDGDRLEFALPDLDGNVVRSDDPRFDGEVRLVVLWGTWCPPCLTEIPTFVDLQRRLGPRGLRIVAIAFEDAEDTIERRAHLRRFVEEQSINYLVLDGGEAAGAGEALPALRDVRGLPVEILIDRDDTVVEARHGFGYKKKWARKLEARLNQLLDDGER